jgi:SulP family sulfate permease
LKRFIPILQWLPEYDRAYFKGDLVAGLTVGVMLIPQGMAYAMLAGLPPIYGLYASTLPLILYAIFGTSRQLAVGPVAMVALLIATGVSNMAEPGSDHFIQLAILLALMVGAIQLLLGLFRLGFMVNFLSHPVISGFTSAAALIIGFSQLKHLLGIEIQRSSHVHQILIDAFNNIDQLNLPTLLIGLAGILIILFSKRKKLPGPLLAVILGILAVYGFQLQEIGVKIVQEVPKGLPSFEVPIVDELAIPLLLPAALTIALVGFMESIAVAKAIQAKHKDYQIDANQELIGLGVANIVGSLFKAFPTVGGFSRTAVNDQAGANTGLASIISAVLIILTLLFLTPLFYYLPQAILASVIMVAVFGLIDYKEALHLWHTDRTDFLMLTVTFVSTLILGIEIGIAIGVILSLAMVLYRSAYPHIASLGRVPDTQYYRNVERFDEVIQRDDVLIMRFDAPLFFANSSYFQDHLNKLVQEKGKNLKLIVLNAEAISRIDSSAIHMLSDVIKYYREQGITIYFAAVIGPVRDIFYQSGLIHEIGAENLFVHVHDAVARFDQVDTRELDRLNKVAIQTNVALKGKGNLWD